MDPVRGGILPKNKILLVLGLIIVAVVGIYFILDTRTTTSQKPVMQQNTPSTSNGVPTVLPEPSSGTPSAEDFLKSIPVETPKTTAPAVVEQPKVTAPLSTSTKPFIDHLTETAFGNGDTISIYGKNFTESNTVLLSIELYGSYVNIPAQKNGTQVTFTANLGLSADMKRNLSKLSKDKHDLAVQKLISVKSKSTNPTPGWYVPATIRIQNENGTSNSVSVLVNILKGI